MAIIAIETTPKQIEKDKRFIEENIKPSVECIDSFRKLNKRLPSQREFKIYHYRIYHHNFRKEISDDSLEKRIGSSIIDPPQPDYIRNDSDMPDELKPFPKSIDWSKNYALSIWRGEWNEYYTSWNNRYIGNNYSWTSSILGSIEMLFIGLLPFLVSAFLRKYNRKKEKTIT